MGSLRSEVQHLTDTNLKYEQVLEYPVLFMQISSLGGTPIGTDPEQDSCHQRTTASLHKGGKNEIATMIIHLMCRSQGILSKSVEERRWRGMPSRFRTEEVHCQECLSTDEGGEPTLSEQVPLRKLNGHSEKTFDRKSRNTGCYA
ncbi:hypothetical protein EDD85DRAFT_788756 [Armillaria nabsnona]|nr:hypothetical protein EDD85DRAFT_788756 [Armillaria nabsnona]